MGKPNNLGQTLISEDSSGLCFVSPPTSNFWATCVSVTDWSRITSCNYLSHPWLTLFFFSFLDNSDQMWSDHQRIWLDLVRSYLWWDHLWSNHTYGRTRSDCQNLISCQRVVWHKWQLTTDQITYNIVCCHLSCQWVVWHKWHPRSLVSSSDLISTAGWGQREKKDENKVFPNLLEIALSTFTIRTSRNLTAKLDFQPFCTHFAFPSYN